MTEPVGKQHVDQTTARSSALREPDAHGCFVRYCCDRIEACVEAETVLPESDALPATYKEMTSRARKLKLRQNREKRQ